MKKSSLLILIILVILISSSIWWWLNENQAEEVNNVNILLTNSNMKITSPNFNHNDAMPVTYSCDGSDINPALKFEEVDIETKSLVLIMDDPDATGGGTFTHWVVYNIDPLTAEISENFVPESALQGKNDFGKESYGGPCPPPGSEHRYFFKLYALDTILDLPAGVTKKELRDAMESHILAKAEIIGRYQRK